MEPMSEERLAHFDWLLREHMLNGLQPITISPLELSALLAEVKRLRAREAALVEVARAVAEPRDPWLPAEGSTGYRCRFCRHWSASGVARDHTADCAWKKARALLAASDATTAE